MTSLQRSTLHCLEICTLYRDRSEGRKIGGQCLLTSSVQLKPVKEKLQICLFKSVHWLCRNFRSSIDSFMAFSSKLRKTPQIYTYIAIELFWTTMSISTKKNQLFNKLCFSLNKKLLNVTYYAFFFVKQL